MSRAFLIVLDSVGCGGAEDAISYGDEGANTLLHIARACATGGGDRSALRSGPLSLPNMAGLGLCHVVEASAGERPPGLIRPDNPMGQWGYGVETSRGKDTPSGHWEIAGTPVDFEWGYFPNTIPALPAALTAALVDEGALPGILGNCHASGTEIIDRLGAAHMRTGKPICYTSVDSVLQIGAHEDTFGRERLYHLCRIGRRLCDPLRIGRVIARPFVGASETGFVRTAHRRDFSIPPPAGTILDRAMQAGRDIVTVGKISDIFAHRSTGRAIKAGGNMALLDAMLPAMEELAPGGLLFANFVDFDSEFGHRRDVAGYAAALEAFDARLPDIASRLRPGDLCILTADHGNDPTWRGTDHTREHTPILAFGPGISGGPIGRRETLSDIGETVSSHLGLKCRGPGRSWL